MGEFDHNIDAKGRLIIPAKFREELGEHFVVTRGFDGCLSAYSHERWAKIDANLRSISLTKKSGRKLSRLILGNAYDCDIDKMGRILIPQTLRDAAELKKDVVIAGLGDRIEIWDRDRWNAINSPEALDEMTDEELTDLEGLDL